MIQTMGERSLQEIRARIIRLGTQVEIILEATLQAIQQGDDALCGQVIAARRGLNELRSGIERLTFQALAGQHRPVLACAPLLAGDLEGIGDNAASIAKLLPGIVPLCALGDSAIPPVAPTRAENRQQVHPLIVEAGLVSELAVLGQEARCMLHEILDAFVEQNVHAIHAIRQKNERVDVRYQKIRHTLMTLLAESHTLPLDSHSIQRVTSWCWIAHNLEQISNHCIHACEHITFFLEGEETVSLTEETSPLLFASN